MKVNIVFVLILLFPYLVIAQWVKTSSSYSGQISSLAINGQNIFAGTNEGLLYSNDEGISWNPIKIFNNYSQKPIISSIAVTKKKCFY
jgi:hypothetical protein